MRDEDGTELERVGRPTRPAAWIGGWLLVLAGVIGIAILAPATSVTPPVIPSDQAVVLTPPPTPSPTPLLIRRPLPSRPPLGEDGLVGGIVFGTHWPPD
jgi:hypothetical protein